MKNIPPSLLQFLGLNSTGDLGPYTIYTDQRRELVFFLKTWPKDPATYHQQTLRNRWRSAGLRWRSLRPETRKLWSTMAHRGGLTITGYNLFIVYILGKNRGVVETIQRNTGIDVITPTGEPIPYLTI